MRSSEIAWSIGIVILRELGTVLGSSSCSGQCEYRGRRRTPAGLVGTLGDRGGGGGGGLEVQVANVITQQTNRNRPPGTSGRSPVASRGGTWELRRLLVGAIADHERNAPLGKRRRRKNRYGKGKCPQRHDVGKPRGNAIPHAADGSSAMGGQERSQRTNCYIIGAKLRESVLRGAVKVSQAYPGMIGCGGSTCPAAAGAPSLLHRACPSQIRGGSRPAYRGMCGLPGKVCGSTR